MMPTLDDIAPAISPDVLISPVDANGVTVVKHPQKRVYLQLGAHETFLLSHLNGTTSFRVISQAFERKFAEPLTYEDVSQFVSLVQVEGLLADRDAGKNSVRDEVSQHGPFFNLVNKAIAAARKQSPFYFRIALFDPDRFLNWLEPRTRWLFRRELLAAATVGFMFAFLLAWANRNALVSQFAAMFGWRTLVLAWLTTIVVTICHEIGHGLACKRYGGEVREMGVLWIFFTPCLFCNVSDTWLVPGKSRRIVVSMAGTYVDLLIWILSVVVWRVTATETALNYMAWIVVSTCGLRVLFNINPLLRLDGYYALSDFLGIPNLRRRARARWMEQIRWLFWGAERPKPVPQGRTLLAYGVTSWVFTLSLLNLLFFKVTDILQSALGIAGFVTGATIFLAISKRYFKGSLGEDFKAMFQVRKKRVMLFVVGIVGILAIPLHDRAGGTFHVRPAVRWEVRAPIEGFLREVSVDEGDHVAKGTVIARLEVPELDSELRRKQAEIHEVEAILRKLEAGPRREELFEQRERIKRAESWRDLAQTDLVRARRSFEEQIASLDLRVAKARSDFEFRETMFRQSQQLYQRGGLAGQQLLSEKKQLDIAHAELYEAQAARRAREAEGVMSYEGELARREKELADTHAALTLLEAGTRPEEVEAHRAQLARLQEEQQHLLVKQQRQTILAPADGTITTPRLREKIGQFLPKGAEFCFVEDQGKLEAEIAVPEENARVLMPGQLVTLKPRSLPFHRLNAVVDRIAPSAAGQVDAAGKQLTTQRTVTVYCRVENDQVALRSGMTGFGRVYHGWRPLGWVGLMRAIQLLRTEFWV